MGAPGGAGGQGEWERVGECGMGRGPEGRCGWGDMGRERPELRYRREANRWGGERAEVCGGHGAGGGGTCRGCLGVGERGNRQVLEASGAGSRRAGAVSLIS